MSLSFFLMQVKKGDKNTRLPLSKEYLFLSPNNFKKPSNEFLVTCISNVKSLLINQIVVSFFPSVL